VKYYKIGKLVISNIAIREDVIFGVDAYKHLFWIFWWKV